MRRNELGTKAIQWEQDFRKSGNSTCKYFVNKLGEVKLKLPSEIKSRKIGKLEKTKDAQGNEIIVYNILRQKISEHIFKATGGSIGINASVLEEFKPDIINLEFYTKGSSLKEKYTCNLKDVREKNLESTYLSFKEQGFETQCFIKLELFK